MPDAPTTDDPAPGSADAPPPSIPLSRRPWFPDALLALLVLCVFANAVPSRFVWDDEQFVVRNRYLASPRHLPELLTRSVVEGAGIESNLYRPLQSLSHYVDVHVWRGWAPGHHLTNLLLQIAAALALFRCLFAILPLVPAWLAAALYAVHPLQSFAVAYVSGRGDTIGLLFLALGLLTFRRSLAKSLSCAALAVAARESFAMFPVFLFLYDRASGRPTPLRSHLPFWGLSAAYALARLTVLNFGNTMNFYGGANLLTEHYPYRVYTWLATLPQGLRLWFWPSDLHHERHWGVYADAGLTPVWLGLGMLLVLLAAAVAIRRRAAPVAAGIAWFFAATLPTSNLIVLVNALYYDHWFVLPGFGLALAAGGGLARAATGRFRKAAFGAAGAAVLACAAVTPAYNATWRTPEALYEHILRYEPDNAKIRNNLGMAYAEEGRVEDAIAQYERAIALDDEFPQTHHNLGNARLAKGETDRALDEFRRAIAMNPALYPSWTQIGAIHLGRKDYLGARAAFRESIKAYPLSVQPYLGLAAAYQADGKSEEARAALEEGLRAIPESTALREALQGHSNR